MTGAPESADDRFGANLRAIRERRGISQAELARLMTARGQPWHQSTVARAEAGRQSVRVGEAEILAAILEVTVDQFLWIPEEAAGAAMVEAAHAGLYRAWSDAADAVARLLEARAYAGRVLAECAGSRHAKAQEACGELSRALPDYTPDTALAEGAVRSRKGNGDGGT